MTGNARSVEQASTFSRVSLNTAMKCRNANPAFLEQLFHKTSHRSL